MHLKGETRVSEQRDSLYFSHCNIFKITNGPTHLTFAQFSYYYVLHNLLLFSLSFTALCAIKSRISKR